jgi:hypothetical protein
MLDLLLLLTLRPLMRIRQRAMALGGRLDASDRLPL